MSEEQNISKQMNKKEFALDMNVLEKNISIISDTLNKTYLSQLEEKYKVYPFAEYNEKDIVSFRSNIRAIKVNKFVFSNKEKIIDCMKNVLATFSHTDNSLGFILHRSKANTSVYFIVKNKDKIDNGGTPIKNNEDIKNDLLLLNDALKGNFPGSSFEQIEGPETENELLFMKNASYVSSICAVPSEKSENFISQGIEKLINGISPKNENEEYSVVILAESLDLSTVGNMLSGLEEIATSITPFLTHQFQIGSNESETKGEMHSITDTQGTNSAIAKIHSTSVGINTSVGIKKIVSIGGSVARTEGTSEIEGKSESISNTTGTNRNLTLGSSENTIYTYKSYMVNNILQKIEANIKRIDRSKSTGLWRYSTYILANEYHVSKNVSQFIRGTIQGEESFIEPAIIKTWIKDASEKDKKFDNILEYVRYFTHPIFRSNNSDERFSNNFITPTTNISTTELAKIFSLPTHSLPGLPVLECAEFGRTVASYDEKNVHGKSDSEKKNAERTTKLGYVYHMHQPESLPVELNTNSLASHTFITGSTGSGKSNTIYQILSELSKQQFYSERKNDNDEDKKVKFLVVEPAKGEYKNVFGTKSGVHVCGTNPELSPMLRLNPFSFPHGNEDASKNIHILEHLDRLIEIFNVCWPMYAAMPAVLKEAVEKSYEDAGWNLAESTNPYGENLYPTFADVARNVRTIIDSSEYDAENKGAYKGALVTRLKSLTNGINGLIFTTDEIADKDLFDENVIVDLSRVGSSETKSLLMGLLVLKLQEYRMTSGHMNEPLKHITVLEEAHNLLKRTSTEQTSESGNLRGKSVEMLSNAIAEMRTYGEGFIIADQAPALLDMSVIRNTNTKIIMRLPDQSDRELVGKAANLNEDQITELAKLPRGVAAVYQNEWVESVLCKVEKFEDDRKFVYAEEFAKMKKKNSQTKENSDIAENMLKNRIDIAKLICSTPTEPKILKDLQDKKYKFSGTLFVNAKKYLDSPGTKPNFNNLSYIVSELLPEFTKTLKDSAVQYPSEVEIWRHDLQEHIESVLENFNMQEDMMLRNNIMQCVLQNYILNELNKPNLLKELQPKAILEMER